MKYLNVFDDKSALDSSVTSINHGDGAYVFGVETAQGIEEKRQELDLIEAL